MTSSSNVPFLAVGDSSNPTPVMNQENGCCNECGSDFCVLWRRNMLHQPEALCIEKEGEQEVRREQERRQQQARMEQERIQQQARMEQERRQQQARMEQEREQEARREQEREQPVLREQDNQGHGEGQFPFFPPGHYRWHFSGEMSKTLNCQKRELIDQWNRESAKMFTKDPATVLLRYPTHIFLLQRVERIFELYSHQYPALSINQIMAISVNKILEGAIQLIRTQYTDTVEMFHKIHPVHLFDRVLGQSISRKIRQSNPQNQPHALNDNRQEPVGQYSAQPVDQHQQQAAIDPVQRPRSVPHKRTRSDRSSNNSQAQSDETVIEDQDAQGLDQFVVRLMNRLEAYVWGSRYTKRANEELRLLADRDDESAHENDPTFHQTGFERASRGRSDSETGDNHFNSNQDGVECRFVPENAPSQAVPTSCDEYVPLF